LNPCESSERTLYSYKLHIAIPYSQFELSGFGEFSTVAGLADAAERDPEAHLRDGVFSLRIDL
jgi:hypothetical protein